MRRGRRGGGLVHEFGGSGEDSFVAVVVTKLTGALLFILLLTMVIMALIPRATDSSRGRPEDAAAPLAITTPEALPEAIVGRPYTLALAATGGQGALRWSVDGPLPEGLSFDPERGRLSGTPRRGTPRPAVLGLRVTDGVHSARGEARLVVYQPDRTLTTPSRFRPALPPIPWDAWMRHGFGFLLLGLVHMVGINTLHGLEARRGESNRPTRRRFLAYRTLVRLATLAAAIGLAAWLVLARVG
jgi:hypothetical protein